MLESVDVADSPAPDTATPPTKERPCAVPSSSCFSASSRAAFAMSQGARSQGARPPAGERGAPFDDSGGRTDTFGTRSFEERSAAMDELLIGAWRLTAYNDPKSTFSPNSIVGYALFVDGFMSIELHVGEVDSFGLLAEFMMSGTYRYTWNDAARLRLTQLIGSTNLNYDEELAFLPPGTTREYAVEIDTAGMRMRRLDDRNGSTGSLFVFQRMDNHSARAKLKRDFFGRIVPDDEQDDADARRSTRVPLEELKRRQQ